MERISGVSILFSVNDRVKPIKKDGFVGQLKKDMTAEIWARVEPGYIDTTWAISVDGRKNVVLKKNHGENGDETTYRFCIPIKIGETGIFHTEYPSNHMRLIRLNGRKVQVWNIALISQNGNFFVTMQKTYEVGCYRDGDKIACPEFEKTRKKIANLFKQILADKINQFPALSEYRPEAEPNADGLEKGQGRVLFWDFAKGWGSIITPEPEETIRVHWSEVAKRPRLAYLVPGEIVKYAGVKLPPKTSDNPNRITTFEKEAMGVNPLYRTPLTNLLGLVKP